MRTIACLAVFGMLFCVTGCSEESNPVLTDPPTGFDVEISLSKDLIYRGQNAELTLEVANYGEAMLLDFNCADHYGFRIKNEAGDIVYEYPSCYSNPNQLVITAGHRETVIFSVPGGTLPVFDEGYYKVCAGLTEHEDLYPWKETGLVILEPR